VNPSSLRSNVRGVPQICFISEAMREGREPLRTFGDLKQFFTAREQADSTPADSQAESSEKPPETSAEPGGEDPTAPGT